MFSQIKNSPSASNSEHQSSIIDDETFSKTENAYLNADNSRFFKFLKHSKSVSVSFLIYILIIIKNKFNLKKISF